MYGRESFCGAPRQSHHTFHCAGVGRHHAPYDFHDCQKDLGYEVLEQPISRDQLYIADEVFVCGTAAECIGLSEIDFRTIGDGKTGPVTRAIQKVYHDCHPRQGGKV